jgi:hypothetical protein
MVRAAGIDVEERAAWACADDRSAIASMTARSRPSEKFGTHSTSVFMGAEEAKRGVAAGQGARAACRIHRGPLSL